MRICANLISVLRGFSRALALLLAVMSVAEAQTVLKGFVEDPVGNSIPEARLKLASKARREERKARSEENGYFEFANVAAGDYFLTVSAKGFDDAVVPVRVGTTPKPPMRMRLAVATLNEEITVTDEASPAIATQNMDAIDIRESLLGRLPVNEGNLLALPSLFLNRSVMGASGPDIVVDGMEGQNLDLPASAVKRLYVNKNPYSAEFSHPGSGRIEVITKDGSRHHYHRNLSVLFRNSALDARNAFAIVRPPTRRTLLEGEFDGPLGSEAVTFIVSGRYFNYTDTAIVTAQTPAGRLVENLDTPEKGGRLLGRLDFKLSPTRTLKAFYKFKDDRQQNRNVGGFNLPERAVDDLSREHRLTVSENDILSASLANDLRLMVKRETDASSARSSQPAIVVIDAFSSGGAQISQHLREQAAELQEVASWSRGNHSLRFGGDLRFRFLRARDASNFGGTFRFSSLADFAANRPFLFTINEGAPQVSFAQHEFYFFLQDEIRVQPNLSLSLGLRHDFQTVVDDRNNLAPRVAVAYAPGGGRTVIRAGAGVFYDHAPKTVMERSLLYDGLRIREADLADPLFPASGPLSALANFTTPSVVRVASDVRSPYIGQASVGVERRLGVRRNFVSAEFLTVRGVSLFRTHNINAPRPQTAVLDDPRFLNINQIESSGFSRSNSLRLTVQTQRSIFEVLSQYTLSRSRDDTSGLFSLPADNFNLRGEFGRADFDRRHRLNVLGTARLPWRLILGTTAQFASGVPFNITTGRDDNRDTVANDRPPGVGRNTGRGPGLVNIDTRLSKRFGLRRSERLPDAEFYVDAFNLLNRVNFRNFVGTLSSPFFARANAADPPRHLQLGLRIRF